MEKGKILKVIEEKYHYLQRSNSILTSDFLTETLETRSHWNNIFKLLKVNNF